MLVGLPTGLATEIQQTLTYLKIKHYAFFETRIKVVDTEVKHLGMGQAVRAIDFDAWNFGHPGRG